jgi:arsenate reductase
MNLIKILYICTHNRCRSILAEAVTKHYAADKILVASAGSAPADFVHPLTLASLHSHGIPIAGLHSKSWDELHDFAPDFVITVCDKAAAEPCPLWFGNAIVVHWSLSDPSELAADKLACLLAFDIIVATLKKRVMLIQDSILADIDLAGMEVVLRNLAEEF